MAAMNVSPSTLPYREEIRTIPIQKPYALPRNLREEDVCDISLEPNNDELGFIFGLSTNKVANDDAIIDEQSARDGKNRYEVS